MDNLEYDNYEIKVKDSSVLLPKDFIRKSDVLTNLILDTSGSNLIILDEYFDIESLRKSYTFYQEIKDLMIKDLDGNDISFIDYIENNLGDIKYRYSSKNIKIPHFEVFKKYSDSKDFMSDLKKILQLIDFLNIKSIKYMLSPVISNLLINLPYDKKVPVYKEMRFKLGHLNRDPDETN